jgi:hypothetical protein
MTDSPRFSFPANNPTQIELFSLPWRAEALAQRGHYNKVDNFLYIIFLHTPPGTL